MESSGACWTTASERERAERERERRERERESGERESGERERMPEIIWQKFSHQTFCRSNR